MPNNNNNNDNCAFLRLNLCGRKFEILKSTAAKFPDSLFDALLCDEDAKARSLIESRGILRLRSIDNNIGDEFFVERSPMIFELIIDCICNGVLHSPSWCCKEALKNELAFWLLRNVSLANCCWDDEDEDIQTLDDDDQPPSLQQIKTKRLPNSTSGYFNKFRNCINRLFDGRASSKTAYVFNFITGAFIMLAIANLIASTVPSLQHCTGAEFTSISAVGNAGRNGNITDNGESNYTLSLSLNSISENASASNNNSVKRRRPRGARDKYNDECEGGFVFDVIETICIIWFTFELTLRFVCSRRKGRFFKTPLNIIDIIAVLPFYLDVVVWLADAYDDHDRQPGVDGLMSALRSLRILRLFNVLRLARYFDSLKLMGSSLWSSRREFGVLVLFIGFATIVFSTIIFYCERGVPDSDFGSIPATFWWAIVTLTTVGYGDMTPKTALSRIFAGIGCVAGIVIVAFPVSILVEHFHRLYRKRSKKAPKYKRSAILMMNTNRINIMRTHSPPSIIHQSTGHKNDGFDNDGNKNNICTSIT